MTIETLLREATAKGLTHLTVYPVMSKDGKTTYWVARATPSTGHHYVQEVDTDATIAVTKVLEKLPAAKKRPAAKVTAAVTEELKPPTQEGCASHRPDTPGDVW